MNAGYTYNVYVNGELELSEVPCAYYVLSSPSDDVDVTVKICYIMTVLLIIIRSGEYDLKRGAD